jgi:hypothetical protein
VRLHKIKPEFVEFIPRDPAEGVLYVSEKHKIAVHRCACGCMEKVVTPLSPADWQIRKEGDMVSLHPSIGNWNYNCKSHYWIRRNGIQWAGALSEREIKQVQERDRQDKARYIELVNRQKKVEDEVQVEERGFVPRWVATLLRWVRTVLRI